jgi:hypothetical protein
MTAAAPARGTPAGVVASAPAVVWLLLHLVVYVILFYLGMTVLGHALAPERGVRHLLLAATFGTTLYGVLAVPIMAGLLLAVRACRGLPPLRFRLVTVAILAGPVLVLLVPIMVASLDGAWWQIPLVHLITALLVIRPAARRS